MKINPDANLSLTAWKLLIDHRHPRHYSRGVIGVPMVDSPEFTVFLYDQGRLDHGQSTEALGHSGASRRLRQRALAALGVM